MSINEELKKAGLQSRNGIIVYLNNISNQYRLRKFGDIVYFSKKMKYCVIYVNSNEINRIKKEILALDFVERIEDSETDQLNLDGTYIEQQINEMAIEAEEKLIKRQEENEDLLN